MRKFLHTVRAVRSEKLNDSSHSFSNMHFMWIIMLACSDSANRLPSPLPQPPNPNSIIGTAL